MTGEENSTSRAASQVETNGVELYYEVHGSGGSPVLFQSCTRRGQECLVADPPQGKALVRCSCGSVALEASGAPILSVVCYCKSCQQGSWQIEALPNGRPTCDSDGGTAYVLFRKDRLEYSNGSHLLQGYKLTDESPTKRVVATCCDSAMYLEFKNGHWLSVYRAALVGDLSPLEMRVHTKSRPAGTDLPDDVPSYPGYSLRFMAKLFAAWIAMLLRR